MEGYNNLSRQNSESSLMNFNNTPSSFFKNPQALNQYIDIKSKKIKID